MVLQQAPAKSAVYCTVGPGGTAVAVTVTGTNDEGQAQAAYTVPAAVAGGQWKAVLKPTKAGGSYTITARCTGCQNATAAALDDVTFGDLWSAPRSIARIPHAPVTALCGNYAVA